MGPSLENILNEQIIVQCVPIINKDFYMHGVAFRAKQNDVKLGPFYRPFGQLQFVHQLSIHHCFEWARRHNRLVIFNAFTNKNDIKTLLHTSFKHNELLQKYFNIEFKFHTYSNTLTAVKSLSV